jgi:hypothetical protein
MTCLSTDIQPMSKVICFLTHNVIQVQKRIGKYPLESGLVFFIALTRANRSDKLQESTTFPMKPYAVFFGQLVKKHAG